MTSPTLRDVFNRRATSSIALAIFCASFRFALPVVFLSRRPFRCVKHATQFFGFIREVGALDHSRREGHLGNWDSPRAWMARLEYRL